ncbi:hypothetical protein QAD02_005279 [Eretmocerus hayati]|uniref:Uncharacterized protein n=1 Tax=Eretmocerus hayati TaxID=131215 RepID=A0ACC2NSC6_9HYME|nr:hypothetical protein QAD02_005279 [Eretmocerus hayati]
MHAYIIKYFVLSRLLSDIYLVSAQDGGQVKNRLKRDGIISIQPEHEVRDGCIYDGQLISPEVCEEKCRKILEEDPDIPNNSILPSNCLPGNECECGSRSLTGITVYESLNDLETENIRRPYIQSIDLANNIGPSYSFENEHEFEPVRRPQRPSSKRCIHGNYFVTEEDCTKMCEGLLEMMGLVNDDVEDEQTMATCSEPGHCMCNFNESETRRPRVLRLDTLEIQHRNRQTLATHQMEMEEWEAILRTNRFPLGIYNERNSGFLCQDHSLTE